MISPAVLERPGRWRSFGIAAVFCIVASPAFVLLTRVAASPEWSLGAGLTDAVGASLVVAGAAATVALVLGLPCGLLAGLYEFRGRRWLLAALALPLLLPSFIWAIGLSMLRIDLGIARDSVLSGFVPVVWSFAALGAPLVAFAALVAVRLLPAGALDAARLAGGNEPCSGTSRVPRCPRRSPRRSSLRGDRARLRRARAHADPRFARSVRCTGALRAPAFRAGVVLQYVRFQVIDSFVFSSSSLKVTPFFVW
jgi:hypothetical protein